MSLPTWPIVKTRATRGKAAARDTVAIVCAASAGIHAALVPEHLREGGTRLGGSFLLAALALAGAAILINSPRYDRWAPVAAMTVLAAVAAAYLLSRTSGVPYLIPRTESPDPLGVLTTTTELGAALAAAALRTPSRKDQP
jgi:peptidoglycan/LPS O-acetylase OafA/YrhL